MKHFMCAIELAVSLRASSSFINVLWGWGSEEWQPLAEWCWVLELKVKGMGLWVRKENLFLCFHLPSFEHYIWTMFLSSSLSTAAVVSSLNQGEFFLRVTSAFTVVILVGRELFLLFYVWGIQLGSERTAVVKPGWHWGARPVYLYLDGEFHCYNHLSGKSVGKLWQKDWGSKHLIWKEDVPNYLLTHLSRVKRNWLGGGVCLSLKSSHTENN